MSLIFFSLSFNPMIDAMAVGAKRNAFFGLFICSLEAPLLY
jgi:hypothetical protein